MRVLKWVISVNTWLVIEYARRNENWYLINTNGKSISDGFTLNYLTWFLELTPLCQHLVQWFFASIVCWCKWWTINLVPLHKPSWTDIIILQQKNFTIVATIQHFIFKCNCFTMNTFHCHFYHIYTKKELSKPICSWHRLSAPPLITQSIIYFDISRVRWVTRTLDT